MRKLFAAFSAFCLGVLSAVADPVTPTTSSDIYNDVSGSGGLVENATSLFNTSVTIILAVVGLGIIISFLKLMKKR